MSVKFFTGLTADFSSKTETLTATDGRAVSVEATLASFTPQDKSLLIGHHDVTRPPKQTTRVSAESVVAPFMTFFDAFRFKAVPVYNFYVDDEEQNDRDLPGDRNLEDIPRYVELTWNIAPALNLRKNEASNKFVRSEEPAAPTGFVSKGVTFQPEYLSDFSVIKGSVANGYVAPAVISSLVDVVPFDTVKTARVVSEELYLADEKTVGVPIHDIQSNMNTEDDGLRVAADFDDPFVSGKFSVSISGDRLAIQNVHSSSPALSFTTTTARASFGPASSLDALASVVVSSGQASVQASPTMVSFVDQAIVGIIEQEKVDSAVRPEHGESIVALAQFLPNLELMSSMTAGLTRKGTLPSFPAPAELVGVEYVGYVIEKYKQTKAGSFDLIDEIDIPDREIGSFIDTRVVYGGVYRYRIKGIVRWTRPSNIDLFGVVAADALSDTFTQSKPVASHRTTYFETEWSRNWEYATVIDTVPPPPPDELTVRPESHKHRIVVTWKMPADQQLDVLSMTLFRKSMRRGRDVGTWAVIGREFVAANGIFFDHDVVPFEENGGIDYVYAMRTTSRHGELSVLSDQISCRLTRDFKIRGEYPVTFVSEAGVMLEHHGAFATKPPRRTYDEFVAKDIVGFAGRVSPGNSAFDDVSYVARLESLDTGEIRDVSLSIDYNNVPRLRREKTTTVRIPTGKEPAELPKDPPPQETATVAKPLVSSRFTANLGTILVSPTSKQ